jgi:hypothetical protein
MGLTITSYNGASIDTGQSPPFGVGAGKFVAASSQYLSIANSSAFYFGTGSFTVDFLVKLNSLPPSGTGNEADFIFFTLSQDSNNYTIFMLQNYNQSSMNWEFQITSAGSNDYPLQYTQTPSTGIWYHMAVVRSGNTWYLFQNGTLLTSNTDSATIPNYTGPLIISMWPNYGNIFYVDGWMKELRFSNTARWTSNFTPPTQPYSPDPYTDLLLHMEGPNGSTTFIDSSTDTTISTVTADINPIYQFMFHPRKIGFPFTPRLVA